MHRGATNLDVASGKINICTIENYTDKLISSLSPSLTKLYNY
jgi:hypothetical protein